MALVEVPLNGEPVVVCGHAEAAEEADPALVDDLPVPVDGVLRGDAQPARLAVEERLEVMLGLDSGSGVCQVTNWQFWASKNDSIH